MSSGRRLMRGAAHSLNWQFLMLALMTIGAPSAIAQDPPPSGYAQMRGACQADYRAHCTGSTVEPACLRQYWANLSKKCQAALQQQRQSALDGAGEVK